MTDSRFARLRGMEENCSIVAHASYAVARELFSHLADPQDENFGRSYKGVSRLFAHCRRYDGSSNQISFIDDAWRHLGHVLFRRVVPNHVYDSGIHARVVGQIATTQPASWSTSTTEFLAATAQFVASSEQQWADNMWNIVQALNPGAKAWSDVIEQSENRTFMLGQLDSDEALQRIAEGLVKAAGVVAQEPESDDVDPLLVSLILRHFPAPVYFYRELLRSLIERGQDMRKRERVNSSWDFQVLVATARDARLDGLPAWLVTTDAAMLSAARLAGAEWHVRSLDEYEQILERGVSGLSSVLEAEPILPDAAPAA